MVGTPGCSSEDPSCDDIRDELAQLQPEAAAAWEDIAVLAEDIARGLELEREYDERCDSGGGDTDQAVIDARADDLRRAMWLMSRSALVLSPDTGPMHIARALGIPVVSLFGHTNPKRSGPYRAFEDLVVDGYATYAGEDYPITPQCRNGMQRVTVDAVLEKVSLAMQRYVRL